MGNADPGGQVQVPNYLTQIEKNITQPLGFYGSSLFAGLEGLSNWATDIATGGNVGGIGDLAPGQGFPDSWAFLDQSSSSFGVGGNQSGGQATTGGGGAGVSGGTSGGSSGFPAQSESINWSGQDQQSQKVNVFLGSPVTATINGQPQQQTPLYDANTGAFVGWRTAGGQNIQAASSAGLAPMSFDGGGGGQKGTAAQAMSSATGGGAGTTPGAAGPNTATYAFGNNGVMDGTQFTKAFQEVFGQTPNINVTGGGVVGQEPFINPQNGKPITAAEVVQMANRQSQKNLLGPMLSAAWDSIQTIQGLENVTGALGSAEANRAKQLYGEGQQLYEQATGNLQKDTTALNALETGTGLFPSQQAAIKQAVQSQETQANAQLAAEGLSSSTMKGQLSGQAQEAGAATAGGLIQGNIASAQNTIKLDQASISAAQQTISLSQNADQIALGADQLTTEQASAVETMSAALQHQVFSEGQTALQTLNSIYDSVLQAFGLGTQAAGMQLQASETQAQIDAQIQENNDTNNAKIMESIITGVTSMIGSIGGGLASHCWVAREVYGENNPQWCVFRFWMIWDSPKWFKNLYMKHGERFARFLKGKNWLKGLIKPAMDRICRKTILRHRL